MSIIQKIEERRRALGRLPVEVPEWGVTLYFKPIGPKIVDAAMRRDKDGQVAQNINILIATAEMEDGTPAFDFGDKATLMTDSEFQVIGRIVTMVMEWSNEPPGNLETST